MSNKMITDQDVLNARMTPPWKFFTPAEANRALVLVRPIVEEIIEQYRELKKQERIIDMAKTGGFPNVMDRARRRLVAAVEEIQIRLEELDQICVHLRNFENGEIDFPALHDDGRAVCLCFIYGEETVFHWHETNENAADRKPVFAACHAVASLRRREGA
jgi:hypothetical protein